MEQQKPTDRPIPSINQERERLGEMPRAFPNRAIPAMRKPSIVKRVAAKVRRTR